MITSSGLEIMHFRTCTAPQTEHDFVSAINLFGFWCYYPFIHSVYNFKWLKFLCTLCFNSLHGVILGRTIVVSYGIQLWLFTLAITWNSYHVFKIKDLMLMMMVTMMIMSSPLKIWAIAAYGSHLVFSDKFFIFLSFFFSRNFYSVQSFLSWFLFKLTAN